MTLAVRKTLDATRLDFWGVRALPVLAALAVACANWQLTRRPTTYVRRAIETCAGHYARATTRTDTMAVDRERFIGERELGCGELRRAGATAPGARVFPGRPLFEAWGPTFAAIFGAYLIERALWRWTAGRARRRRWLQADAEIVATSLEGTGASILDDSIGRVFRVDYRYVVGGQSYTNDHIQPGQVVVGDADALDLNNQYREGHHTVAFYDPDSPQRSALDLGADDFGYGFAVSGFWVFALGVFGLTQLG